MKITGIKYIGPIFDPSGYAQACRGNIMALHSQGVPLTLAPISFEPTRPDLGAEGKILNSLVDKKIDYNIVFIHTTPEFWSKYKEPDKTNVGYTIWETTKLHPDWPGYINENVDKVLVGCTWNHGVFKDSGVTIPIGVVPHGIDMSEFDDIKEYNIGGVSKDDYVFYDIFQWCYDEKTRVLTKDGFKYFKDLKYTDYIATLNKDTDELEYYKPDKIVKFRRKDKMLKLKGTQFDLCVTPDHKMVVKEHMKDSYRVSKTDNWQLKPLNEMVIVDQNGDLKVSGKYRTKKNCIWTNSSEKSFSLPGKKGVVLNMDLFLEFLGWYLSEGSLNIIKSNGAHRVVITQVKSQEYKKEIWDNIKSMGFTPINHGDKGILFNSKDMCLYLKQFGECYEKFIPKFVKSLSSRQIKILLTSMFKGDGSFHKNGTWCKYVTTSKKLAEDIQECLLKIGYSGAISTSDPTTKKIGKIDGREIRGKRLQYTVSVNRENNEPSMYYADLQEIDYDGYVYCATVPNHNMLVERNGKILFCGNTERKHPLVLIKAYWHAFQNNENVALVLKTYRSDYSEPEKDAIRTTIKRLKKVTPMEKYPKIYLILNLLSNKEITGLHATGDCYVSFDRGEGWGLGPFTAAACGNPIIITGFGGSTEYAKEDNSYLINYSLTPVFGQPWSPWYRGDQLWAEPDVKHGADLMRYVYEHQEEAKQKGEMIKKYIADNFTWKHIGQKIIKEIEEI